MWRAEITGILLLILLFILMIVVARALLGGTILKTDGADRSQISGTFTLMLIGGTHADDLETFALLDREGDRYVFEPFVPAYRLRIIPGLSAEEAMDRAENFVKMHHAFHQFRVSRVLDERSNAIGYEVRPLYMPEIYGFSDLLQIGYTFKRGKVYVACSLLPDAQRKDQGGP